MSDDQARVLADHRRECDGEEWCAECVCGWIVPEGADDFTAAHRAHVDEMLAAARLPNPFFDPNLVHVETLDIGPGGITRVSKWETREDYFLGTQENRPQPEG